MVMAQNDRKPRVHPKIGIATVGGSSTPVLKGFRHTPVDKQFLLCNEKMLEFAMDAKQKIDGIADSRMCEIVKIDHLDFQDILMKIIKIKKEAPPEAEIVVNITGGTNIMASAALVACFTIGARAFYIKKEETGSELPLEASVIDIPVPKIPLDSLNISQRKLIKLIYDHGGKVNKVTTTLSLELNKKKGTISSALRKLKKKDLIHMGAEGREKTVELTAAGNMFARLIS